MSLPPLDMNRIVGERDIVFITLDTLRWDVADALHRAGRTPSLSALVGTSGWERRHAPASFTYAAHHAFFAGFLPTPTAQPMAKRLFAARFLGSESVDENTYVFDAPDLPTGLASAGYRTICVGGVGFFNRQTPLGEVLPGMFQESAWDPSFGVTSPACVEAQIDWVEARLPSLRQSQRLFLFMNVAALHQPNHHYLQPRDDSPAAGDADGDVRHRDTKESHGAALEYIDRTLPRLFRLLSRRADLFVIVCSDHGTCYGDDGYSGHRLAHEAVWNVPYAHFFVDKDPS